MKRKVFSIILVLLITLCLAAMGHAQSRGKKVSSSGQAREFSNSIGMTFVLIPAGSFLMGCNSDFEKCNSRYETPQHRVTISKPFYMGKYEVTQEQWLKVIGSNPAHFKGRSNPVEKVGWDEVQVFLKKLRKKEGRSYRLPTEAEWEYAARAGSESKYSFGNAAEQLGQYAWYENNSGSKTHPVGQKLPNAWGLYDMHGNVNEWCADWYDENYYGSSPKQDPSGPSSGQERVYRGGSWGSNASLTRAAERGGAWPDSRSYGSLGFRVVLPAR